MAIYGPGVDSFRPYYLHGIGRIGNSLFNEIARSRENDFEEIRQILKTIELINKFGILSYNMQKDIIGTASRRSYLEWNGKDYVSLSDPEKYASYLHPWDYEEYHNDFSTFHNPYFDIAFVVSKDISRELEFKEKGSGSFMMSEVQVKDMVDRKYILGLRVPSVYSEKNFNDEEVLDDVKGYYNRIFEENILFLQQNFAALPLYASFTGEEIPKQLSYK